MPVIVQQSNEALKVENCKGRVKVSTPVILKKRIIVNGGTPNSTNIALWKPYDTVSLGFEIQKVLVLRLVHESA